MFCPSKPSHSYCFSTHTNFKISCEERLLNSKVFLQTSAYPLKMYWAFVTGHTWISGATHWRIVKRCFVTKGIRGTGSVPSNREEIGSSVPPSQPECALLSPSGPKGDSDRCQCAHRQRRKRPQDPLQTSVAGGRPDGGKRFLCASGPGKVYVCGSCRPYCGALGGSSCVVPRVGE